MTMTQHDQPQFNLWDEPWVPLERSDGTVECRGIGDVLKNAHEYRDIVEPSPLIVVGVLRLLIAVLQDALQPQRDADLSELWSAGHFSGEELESFGQQYRHRFDLFSPDCPFLQSGDLPLSPAKGANTKSVGYLMPDLPTGDEITHYRHGEQKDYVLCPACAARGLVVGPAFATSGGAGIRPSINGVPPIYVMPHGETLFATLAASLICPDYAPEAALTGDDPVWWRHDALVPRSAIVNAVGYLHSLTFPARRVRLHVKRQAAICTRCGAPTDLSIRTMVFDMGEYRPKDAPFWRDPFAAYRLPKKRSPTPVRPQMGKALWREYASLLLKDAPSRACLRPRVLDQLGSLYDRAEQGLTPDLPPLAYRCVGLRTDMKAKVFEWVDGTLDAPPGLLCSAKGAILIDEAIAYATSSVLAFHQIFPKAFSPRAKSSNRHRTVLARAEDGCWAALAQPFRELALRVGADQDIAAARALWADQVRHTVEEGYRQAADSVGDDGVALRHRYEGEMQLRDKLGKLRKEYIGNASN